MLNPTHLRRVPQHGADSVVPQKSAANIKILSRSIKYRRGLAY